MIPYQFIKNHFDHDQLPLIHPVAIYTPLAYSISATSHTAPVLRNQGPGVRYKLRALLDFMVIYMLQILKK
jgi:hypothetical protein